MKLDQTLSSLDVSEEAARAALEKAPELKPLLMRFARKALKGQPVPRSFTGDVYSYETQQLLERLLHTGTGRTSDGKVYGTILDFMREPSHWRGLIRALGLEGETVPKDPVSDLMTRLTWQYPQLKEDIDFLATLDVVKQFLRKPEGRQKWKVLFERACALIEETDETRTPTTLSQLGSDWFNDSKCLRSGPLYGQLVTILAVFGNMSASDRAVLEAFRIYDNPYTRSVLCFAPFAFTTRDGQYFDFPRRLFEAGLACQLPVQTVAQIVSITWEGVGKKIVTSENAAPLVRFVQAKTPFVYTEGYPNSAVMNLLKVFAQAELKAIHYGDTDLDGFLIAAHVGLVIPLDRVVAEEIIRQPGQLKGIPLTAEQMKDVNDCIESYPADWPLQGALKRIRELGCWYEQEAFPL